MVTTMQNGKDAQLTAVANFLRANKLHNSLARQDWPAFARGYDGSDFQKNQYGTRLASSFASFSVSLPDIKVRQTQVMLLFLGIDVGTPDGIVGKRTRSGVTQFRAQQGLGPSDTIDDALIAALFAKLGRQGSTTAAGHS